MRKKLKLALVAIGMLTAGAVTAQTTSTTSANINNGAGTIPAIRLIDNKGTIKYLQSNNGITTITSTNGGSETTTTWQLGGTLTENTYITADGSNTTPADKKIFALDGLELVTDITTASTNTDTELNGSSHTIAPDGTVAATDPQGFTVLIRDEATGALQKMRLSDLLQVTASQTILEGGTLPTVGTPAAITDLPADVNKVSVYRNGAKLIANRDYTVTAGNLTLVDRSASTLAPQDWTLYSTDIIEVQWVR